MDENDKIEKLRSELHEIISSKELLDQEVIELSQRLDIEIVNLYKLKKGCPNL